MSVVISASRRTDLVAHFPDWLAGVLRAGRARVVGPTGRVVEVDLKPENVHTLVLWSKNFSPLIKNKAGLKDLIGRFDQIFCHFTVTGLGGTSLEPGVPEPGGALAQLPELIKIPGAPERLSLRFDPVIFWREGREIQTNFSFFETLAPRAASLGIRDIRFSFAQWYGKARRRAQRHGFMFVDPDEGWKQDRALTLAETAFKWGLNLFACSQNFLCGVPGIKPSSCIDGRRLNELHPRHHSASETKDRSQRPECLCTESRDIGSYTQSCPHGCLYCYANPVV